MILSSDQGDIVNVGGDSHPIQGLLRSAIDGLTDPDAIVAALMRILDDHHLVTVRPAGEMPLLTPAGRVMVDLARHPDSTLRQLSMRLGTTESNVAKQMTNLVGAGLIERTRLGKRNSYRLNLNKTLSHSDIGSLLDVIIRSARDGQ